MLLKLPFEIQLKIAEYLDFETNLSLCVPVAKKQYDPEVHTLVWATLTNSSSAFKWLLSTRNYPKNYLVYVAKFSATYGYVDKLKQLFEKFKYLKSEHEILWIACRNGQLDVVKLIERLLLEIPLSAIATGIQNAMENNHLEIVISLQHWYQIIALG
jgi:hypothetical protein